MTMKYRGYTREQIAKTIDHSVLRPEFTSQDIRAGAQIARDFDVASYCIRPMDVALAAQLLEGSGVPVCTVIGFPHGTTTSAVKAFETAEAIENGATEIDMVINVSALISGDYELVRNDIKAVVESAKAASGKKGVSASVKVIFETSLLNDDLIVKACELTEAAGADYVKTSTGFSNDGATVHNVALMKKTVGDRLKVKSSGGVRTLDQLCDFMDLGVTRSGSSNTAAILADFDRLAIES